MKIKVKKLHPDAEFPTRGSKEAAGYDLKATSSLFCVKDAWYGTGLSVEIPKGYVGLLFPRSSIGNTDLRLTNSVGVLDSDYRGEIGFRFKATASIGFSDKNKDIYKLGDRIGQLVVVKCEELEFEEGELSSTERGEGGFGSTGK